jgi:hypothetical protein
LPLEWTEVLHAIKAGQNNKTSSIYIWSVFCIYMEKILTVIIDHQIYWCSLNVLCFTFYWAFFWWVLFKIWLKIYKFAYFSGWNYIFQVFWGILRVLNRFMFSKMWFKIVILPTIKLSKSDDNCQLLEIKKWPNSFAYKVWASW